MNATLPRLGRVGSSLSSRSPGDELGLRRFEKLRHAFALKGRREGHERAHREVPVPCLDGLKRTRLDAHPFRELLLAQSPCETQLRAASPKVAEDRLRVHARHERRSPCVNHAHKPTW